MTYPRFDRRTSSQAFSVPSLLAIVCAIGSFFADGGMAIFLAIAAIILGAVGIMLSLSPRTRGGVMSAFSIIAGALGIIAAIIKFVI
jgi:uncharacterized membrane protein HdeD (DUF308 family)